MRRAADITIALLAGCVVAGAPGLLHARPGGELALVVRAAETEIGFGEAPDLEVAFENRATSAQVVILPVEGSSDGRIVPAYLWEVSGPDPTVAPHAPSAAEAVTRPLSPKAFTRLPAGGRQVLDRRWLGGPERVLSFTRPGVYRVRLRYVLDKARMPKRSRRADRSLSDRLWDSAIESMWLAARGGTVVSNTFEIRVREPDAALEARIQALPEIRIGLTESQVVARLGASDQDLVAGGSRYLTFALHETRAVAPGSPRPDARPYVTVVLGATGRVVAIDLHPDYYPGPKVRFSPPPNPADPEADGVEGVVAK